MIRELYCRMPSDRNYIPNKIEINSEIEEILQRVRVCLGTKPGEVLGDETFGIDLEKYIFSMSFNQKEIKKELQDILNTYLALDSIKYQVSVDINYGHDIENHSDYAIIDIIINQQKALGILVA